MAAEARRHCLGRPAAGGVGMEVLENGGRYDIRRVTVGPGQRHGPEQYAGDACVMVLDGDVRFTVDGEEHPLALHDLLWVPAGARRGFVAGGQGATLLAIHLPPSLAQGA